MIEMETISKILGRISEIISRSTYKRTLKDYFNALYFVVKRLQYRQVHTQNNNNIKYYNNSTCIQHTILLSIHNTLTYTVASI